MDNKKKISEIIIVLYFVISFIICIVRNEFPYIVVIIIVLINIIYMITKTAIYNLKSGYSNLNKNENNDDHIVTPAEYLNDPALEVEKNDIPSTLMAIVLSICFIVDLFIPKLPSIILFFIFGLSLIYCLISFIIKYANENLHK